MLGKDGIKKVIEIVTDKMTYDRTVAFMAEMPKVCETGEEDDITLLDRILWSVRWAYITGYYDALDVYDTAIGGEVNASEFTQKAEAMTDEEFCEAVRRVNEQLGGLTDERKAPTPRRVQNPSQAQDLTDNMTADQLRKEIEARLMELTEDELEGFTRVVDAVSSGDDEALYQCWREILDKSDSIPDDLMDNEFVKRYLAESSGE